MSQPSATNRTRPDGGAPPDVRGHRLDAVIGQGGSSVVWRGTDAAGHPVAVKVPHLRADPVALEQATLERHVLMAVEHEHLVGLRDVVPMDDGRVALVFDLVTGALLSGLVRRRGHLRPGEVVTVLTPLCEAVTALHAAGGTHGDISAGNVMLTEAGRPLLLDLGASRVIAATPGDGFGTAGFIAPEVRRGAPANARSDVFSLGALAWFCATGNGAPDTDQRLDPDIVSSHVGAALAFVVGACIDPDPTRRPQGERLARMFYDASRPEPVEVVLGGDDAAALTHRLREQAADEDPVPQPVGRWSSLVQRLKLDRRGDITETETQAAQRYASAAASVDTSADAKNPQALSGLRGVLAAVNTGESPNETPTTASTGRQRRGKSLLRSVVALAVVVGGAVAVSAAVAGGPHPRPNERASGPTLSVPTGQSSERFESKPSRTAKPASATDRPPTTPPTETARPDPRRDRRAPKTHAVALVAALSASRAEAFGRRDRTVLNQVHRADSPSWKADAQLIASMKRNDQRWQSLHPSVVSARLVQQQGERAVVRTQVGWSPYDEIEKSGLRQRRPAEAGAPLDLTLVWLKQGWRLESVSEPTS